MPEKPEAENMVFFYSLPTILIFIVACVLSFFSPPQFTWIHLPFHSAIEAIGAVIALILAAFILSSGVDKTKNIFEISAASALICMGILDLFHSFVEPGQVFVWLHSTATFSGGLFFALVWISPDVVCKPFRLPIVCLVATVSFSFISILFPEKIPIMIYDSHFTLFSKLLNLIGGVGFIASAIWFYRRYFKTSDKQLILFANNCVLFGVSATIFEFSKIWNYEWWLWHGTRLGAYMIALSLIFLIYKRIDDQKEMMLIQLTEALENIRVLKGFLPICASCKKIRDDKGHWSQMEVYIRDHSEAEFSHGICPDCAKKLYPEYTAEISSHNQSLH